MGTIYLIRHGETPWNQQARYQGQMDIELSEQGLRQAGFLGKRLQNFPLAAIYSSDLNRAHQTAVTIAQYHGLDVPKDPRLRETHFGVWEGLTRDEIKQVYPDLFRQRYSAAGQAAIPGAESPHAVQDRMLAALGGLARTHAGETIAVVSHGGAMRLVFCSILSIPLDEAYRFRMYNTSLSELAAATDSEGVHWSIRSINDTSHLQRQEVIGH